MGMPPLMALLPSLTARGLTKMSSSPATLQLVRVAPYSAMLGGDLVTNGDTWFLITYVALVPSPRSRVTHSIITIWKRNIYI